MALSWISRSPRPASNLVVFVHGFTGGNETFRNEANQHISSLLDKQIIDSTDFVEFLYYSRLFPTIRENRLLSLVSKWFHSKKNRDPSLYAVVLKSECDAWLTKYKTVSFICHSLGGLIVKRLLLDYAKLNKRIPGLYITLATPHKGVEMAAFGKLLNVHIESLRPHSGFINTMEEDWSLHRHLIEGRYLVAIHDQAVLPSAARPVGSDLHVFHTDCDHLSIAKPSGTDDQVVRIINELVVQTITSVGDRPNRPEMKGDPFFISYQGHHKKWYVEREIDSSLRHIARGHGAWIYGCSGYGKTNAIQYLINETKAHPIFIDFAPCGRLPGSRQYAQIILNTITGETDVAFAEDLGEYEIIQRISNAIANIKTDDRVVLALDEIQTSDGAVLEQLIQFLVSLRACYQRIQGGKALDIIVSSLAPPSQNVSALIRDRLSEFCILIEMKGWKDIELRKLVRCISSAISMPVSLEIEEEVVRLSSGSPRKVKTFFRYIHFNNITIHKADDVKNTERLINIGV